MKKTKIHEIDLEPILDAQLKFDRLALQNARTDADAVRSNMEIGLFVEAGEMINELERLWKHWKQNHRNDKEKITDELADVLHLIMSRGVYLNVSTTHEHVTIYLDPVEHLRQFCRVIMDCGQSKFGWWTCFSLFRGLLDHLNITWDDMADAYWIKHQTNIDRQKAKY
jgi:dimeric dUTPase (all-alpha-NTP-PPase superfamily)